MIDNFGLKYICFSTDNANFSNCGSIHPTYFNNNIQFFTESQHHNTCLNRKICIDAEGNIKNCPAMSQSYGNIKYTPIAEIIGKQGFKDCWYICKDKIDVCKDCEFRHICTDCRAFIKDPKNILSQPAKCGYNPYIAKWNGQENYVPIEECGSYSKETGFVPDEEKIAKLNAEIWNE
jgi:SPASM domain peptide maturase of grasp-with-spasm system